MILQAKENLIYRRETHLDQLIDKLSEPQIRDIIEPMINSESDTKDIDTDRSVISII